MLAGVRETALDHGDQRARLCVLRGKTGSQRHVVR
jgi:hypothetical protein